MKVSKEEFVEKLGELLQMANIEVESARLVHGETIVVKFECGAEQEINESKQRRVCREVRRVIADG